MDDPCLFCRAAGPYTTIEHIVPESLGNTDDIIRGVICDGCQKYFGHAIEQPVLDSSPLAFWRTALAIPTKKGRLPSVTMGSRKSGRLPSRHPLTDSVGFSAQPDRSVSADLGSRELADQVASGERQDFKFVLTPWHLSLFGRFLGKMALEFMARSDRREAESSRHDELRRFVRFGSTNMLWPVFYSVDDARWNDLVVTEWTDHGIRQETVLYYRHALARSVELDSVFAFSMGTETFMICLDHPRPEEDLLQLLPGPAQCLWYEYLG